MSTPFANNCSGVRYLNKSNNCNERKLIEEWWAEQINIYGQEVDYYVNGYTLSGHDFFYGESPTEAYHPPKKIIMAITLNENSAMLQKFGLMSDDEVSSYVSISGFEATFGEGSEPKSGDVFALTEYASDRPNGRGAKQFQITDRIDQDIAEINALMGHYVWLIKAKRYDHSFVPGISAENLSNQVYDDTFSGLLSGYTQDPSAPKTYSDEVDAFGIDEIFDYDEYEGSNDDIYGSY